LGQNQLGLPRLDFGFERFNERTATHALCLNDMIIQKLLNFVNCSEDKGSCFSIWNGRKFDRFPFSDVDDLSSSDDEWTTMDRRRCRSNSALQS
jgi:hypothetical protein